jgi:heme-degrading monooxygenase HmoA
MMHTSGQRGWFRRWAWRVSGAVIAACGAAGLASCEVATPFRGPGFERGRGVTLPGAGDRVVVGITNARIAPGKRALFNDHTQRVIDSLNGNDGYIGHSVRLRLLGSEAWTMTAWRDEAALDAFVRSPVHREAMREGTASLTSARFMRMEWPAAEMPPPWREILKRLEAAPEKSYGDRP